MYGLNATSLLLDLSPEELSLDMFSSLHYMFFVSCVIDMCLIVVCVESSCLEKVAAACNQSIPQLQLLVMLGDCQSSNLKRGRICLQVLGNE